MESCFPPLLRGGNNSANSTQVMMSSTAANGKNQKNYRHSLGSAGGDGGAAGGLSSTSSSNNNRSADKNEYLPKLDVIQDLDLYYIRQIACSLKVSMKKKREEQDGTVLLFNYWVGCEEEKNRKLCAITHQ